MNLGIGINLPITVKSKPKFVTGNPMKGYDSFSKKEASYSLIVGTKVNGGVGVLVNGKWGTGGHADGGYGNVDNIDMASTTATYEFDLKRDVFVTDVFIESQRYATNYYFSNFQVLMQNDLGEWEIVKQYNRTTAHDAYGINITHLHEIKNINRKGNKVRITINKPTNTYYMISEIGIVGYE